MFPKKWILNRSKRAQQIALRLPANFQLSHVGKIVFDFNDDTYLPPLNSNNQIIITKDNVTNKNNNNNNNTTNKNYSTQSNNNNDNKYYQPTTINASVISHYGFDQNIEFKFQFNIHNTGISFTNTK